MPLDASVSKFCILGGLDSMYFLMFSFLVYFCMSIYVWNLSRFLVGAYFKPLSNVASSALVSSVPLRLYMPSPNTLFFFWTFRPALHPLFCLGFFPCCGVLVCGGLRSGDILKKTLIAPHHYIPLMVHTCC